MKKYFKKLTAILVVLVMLLASVPASAQTTSTHKNARFIHRLMYRKVIFSVLTT